MSTATINLLTYIGRILDGMILVATQDLISNNTDYIHYKDICKNIIKNINQHSPSRCSIDTRNSYYFHYIIDNNNIIYITLTDKSYPKKLAFQYLYDIEQSFNKQYTIDDINRFSRPYACIQYESTLMKLRRQYIDPNTSTNVNKLNNELHEIHNIMSQNINNILQRGEKLDSLNDRSNVLLNESKKFKKLSRNVYLQQLYKSYMPAVVFAILIIVFIWWKVSK